MLTRETSTKTSTKTSWGGGEKTDDLLRDGSAPNVKDHMRIRDRMRVQLKNDAPRLGRSPRVKGMEGRSVGTNSPRFNQTDMFSSLHHGSRKFLQPRQSRVQLS